MTRDAVHASGSFKLKEGVRTALWDPLNASQFAAATEGGIIQIWDVRATGSCVHKTQAHQGPIYTMSWHPTHKNRLATGG